MNPAWPSALLCIALIGSVPADEADELRKLGAGVFTTAGEVTEINLNRSKITDTQSFATLPCILRLSPVHFAHNRLRISISGSWL